MKKSKAVGVGDRSGTPSRSVFWLLASVSCLLLAGCVARQNVGVILDTTVGITARTPPPNAYQLSIGWHRSEYVVVPVSTNGTTPDLISRTDADVSPFFGKHKMRRIFATGTNGVNAATDPNWFPAETNAPLFQLPVNANPVQTTNAPKTERKGVPLQ